MALFRSGSFIDRLLRQDRETQSARKESRKELLPTKEHELPDLMNESELEGFQALLEEYGLDDSKLDAAARYCRLPQSVSWSFLLNHVSRWEGLPLTSVDSVDGGEDGGATLVVDGVKGEEEEKQEDSIKKNPIKVLKMAVPHIILISILLSYVAAGSLILQRLENGTEVTQRYDRLVRLDQTFRSIVNETWRLKQQTSLSYDDWHKYIYDGLLQNISLMYEKRRLSKDDMQLQTEWTFPTAVLYTLTVLTACGYSHIDPLTDTGKLFAVGFALVGIPLMFITAADIGKFLSETFKKVCLLWRRCSQAFLWKFCRRRMKKREKAAAANNNKSSSDALDDLMDPEAGGGGGSTGDPGEESGLWFPISAYLFLMCLYCSVGAILFRSYENEWGFVHAFHFAFNTVVTVGMGNVVVTDIFYLCMIVAYVIIGLAVVTMCVDLASTHLQRYFQKIHYFGRARRRFLGMSEDIREMVGLIAAMRKKKGGKVTWNDLKKFMESEAGAGWEGRLSSFIPRNVHLWKYIDDTSSAVSSYRHNSLNSCSSMASAALGPRDRDRERERGSASGGGGGERERRGTRTGLAAGGHHHHHHHRERSSEHYQHSRGAPTRGVQRGLAPPPPPHLSPRAPTDDFTALVTDVYHKHELTPPEPGPM